MDEPGHNPSSSGSVTRRAMESSKTGAAGFLGGVLTLAATAVAGPLAGVGISALVSSVQKFTSSTRGDARAATVHQLAAAEIRQRIEAGESVREDGFFDDTAEGRSAGEEAWESVLSKCRQESSERKLPYMAHLLAGIAFDASVDLDTAHQVITAAEELTYSRYCRSHGSHSRRNSSSSIASSAWPTSHSANVPLLRLSTRFPVAHLPKLSMLSPESCTEATVPVRVVRCRSAAAPRCCHQGAHLVQPTPLRSQFSR